MTGCHRRTHGDGGLFIRSQNNGLDGSCKNRYKTKVGAQESAAGHSIPLWPSTAWPVSHIYDSRKLGGGLLCQNRLVLSSSSSPSRSMKPLGSGYSSPMPTRCMTNATSALLSRLRRARQHVDDSCI